MRKTPRIATNEPMTYHPASPSQKPGPQTHTSTALPMRPPDEYDEPLLNKEQVRCLLNLPSIRGVDELIRRRCIPVLRIGHRTARFRKREVLAAIDRFNVEAVY